VGSIGVISNLSSIDLASGIIERKVPVSGETLKVGVRVESFDQGTVGVRSQLNGRFKDEKLRTQQMRSNCLPLSDNNLRIATASIDNVVPNLSSQFKRIAGLCHKGDLIL
jgi:hypothetical protein